MILSPFLDRNDSPLFCFALPGTDFIAQMLPLLNIMFGRSSQGQRRRTKHGYEVASTLRLLYQQMLRKNSSVFDVNSSDRKNALLAAIDGKLSPRMKIAHSSGPAHKVSILRVEFWLQLSGGGLWV